MRKVNHTLVYIHRGHLYGWFPQAVSPGCHFITLKGLQSFHLEAQNDQWALMVKDQYSTRVVTHFATYQAGLTALHRIACALSQRRGWRRWIKILSFSLMGVILLSVIHRSVLEWPSTLDQQESIKNSAIPSLQTYGIALDAEDFLQERVP